MFKMFSSHRIEGLFFRPVYMEQNMSAGDLKV